jgi:sigma-B regulation protein RsbQ
MNALKRNNVKVLGHGRKAMVFAHGYGCDQNMWRFITPAFQEDYRVVLFDHVGAGHSDISAYSPAKYGTLQGYANDVLELCEALELEDAVYVGHSVSAVIGILAAIREPARFEKLVLIGPSPRYINDGDYVGGFSQEDIEGLMESLESNYLGWSSMITPVIMGNPERPELAEELNNSFCRTHPEIARHFARVTFLSDNRADLSRCMTPSLILQCSEDMIAPETVGDYVHRHLAHSQLRQLQATGHCPHLSAPAETVAAMRTFV